MKISDSFFLEKDILVIGGAGFVGSCLCENLVRLGAHVYSVDNYFTGKRENHIEGVEYIECESSNINKLESVSNLDIVYHLGEYSRVEQSFEDIDLVFEYNMKSIYEVLKFVKIKGAKLVYSGSSTKFGDGGLNGSESPYAWTKKTNAELVSVFCNWFNIDYAITYFYNVYGPREIQHGKYATLIAKYMNLVQGGDNTLPVVLPGSQRRNFTHIDDIISGLLVVGSNGSGDGFGIGSDESFSVLDVVALFDCEPVFLPERKGNRMLAPVKTELTKSLGWSCRYSLERYIAESKG